VVVKKIKIFRQIIREILLENLDDAQVLSQYAHRGQKRRSGEPYSFHPQRVADIIKTFYPGDEVAYYAALFHDIIEDAIPLGNIEDEEELYTFIADIVEDDAAVSEIINVVKILTKPRGGDYGAYIDMTLQHPTALKVKISDMIQNLSDFPSDNQRKKYADAFLRIVDKVGGKPSAISGDHWNTFEGLIKNGKE